MFKHIVVAVLLSLWIANVSQAAPKIEHWKTSNGLSVYYVSAPSLPMLDMELVFAGGSVRDGAKSGVSLLTAALLNKGADGLTADQVAEAFEDVGATFSASSNMERSSISLRTVTFVEEMESALQTWLKVVGKPEFPEQDFKRTKKQALIGLQAQKQKPGSIAEKAFYKALYGDHPYGVSGSGTEATINAMTVPDLKAYYQQYYVAKNGMLAMVGAIDRKQAEVLAERVSKVLKVGTKAAAVPEVKPLTQSKTVRVDFPSSQSHVYIGQIGNKRGDADYYSLYLGNHVLGGGGFTSRLMKEVRVKRGLSYSVYSYFMPQGQLGPYILGLQTKNKNLDEAIKVAREVLIDFVEKGPSDEEIKQSKQSITGGFPLRTASNANIISYISMIGFYGLSLNYLEEFSPKIEKLSREQVVDAFKRRVQPDKMVTIVVGGKKKS
ncbi:MAG: insulinase family protein [Thiotrichaceae bacterium]|nr:insulinase family protein [Thiotrichaceae bacterium]